MPPLHADPAGNLGNAPAGPVEVDRAGVFVIDLHPVGNLVQGPGQKVRAAVLPLEKQEAAPLRAGEPLEIKDVFLPDQPSAVLPLRKAEGGAGRTPGGGPALKEVPVQLLRPSASPGHRLNAPLRVQRKQNVVEHEKPPLLRSFRLVSVPQGRAAVNHEPQNNFAYCKNLLRIQAAPTGQSLYSSH